MTKSIVVYDTKFGNTEKIAKALAMGIENKGIKVDCINVESVQFDKLAEYNLIAIGGPTHGFGMSKPIKIFIGKLEQYDLRNKNGFAFDTKTGSKFWGSAAKGIEKRLRKLGLNIIKPYASAIVKGLKGPLEDGIERRFTQIGAELSI